MERTRRVSPARVVVVTARHEWRAATRTTRCGSRWTGGRRARGARAARSLVAFWLLGLLNNASFVIMIASAKSIASGGVGFVYLADTLPGFALKASAPFWFERVSYARACSRRARS